MFNFNTNRRASTPDFSDLAAKQVGGAKNTENPVQSGADAAGSGAMNPKNMEIEAQRLAFMRKYPDFDILAEMKNNPKFVEYVWGKDLSVEEAYLLLHRDEIIRAEAERELARIAARKDRIAENGASKNSPAAVRINPKDMTDKEIDSVIKRAQNGEKISF